MRQKDCRFKLLNEILAGIKILKLYAWEPSFERQLLNHREKELQNIKMVNYINAFGSLCWLLAPYLVSVTWLLSKEKNLTWSCILISVFIFTREFNLFFNIFLGFISPFRGATEPLFWDFWWSLLLVSVDPSLVCFLARVILRITSGATPADCNLFLIFRFHWPYLQRMFYLHRTIFWMQIRLS